jgi:transposase
MPPRVEVITGPERRRRWSEEEKRAIVAKSMAPGATVSEVARRAEVCAGQIYRWRQEFRTVANGFAQVLMAPPEPSAELADRPVVGEPAIEVEFAGKVRVRIPASVPTDLAAAVVKALARLSTDVQKWTLSDNKNWTPVCVLLPQPRCWGGLSR